MKAVVHRKFGSTKYLRIEEMPKPTPGPGEVLVKIYAAGVNSWDGDMIKGKPLIYRLLFGIFKPRYPILGCDVAGVVEATGEGINHLQPGDRVFGDISDHGCGGYAEYVATKASALAKIPENVSFLAAASLPQAGLLTMQSLRFNGRLKRGAKVLFNGAGGGVGTMGLQLAKSWGAEVTVVDHADKLNRLKELGADHLIDYTTTAYTQQDKQYDLVIDVVAQRPLREFAKVIKKGGALAIVGGKLSTLIQAGLWGRRLSRRVDKKLGIMGMKYLTDDLTFLAHQVSEGKLKTVIGQVYPMEKTPEALQQIIDGTAFGKLVIKIREDD